MEIATIITALAALVTGLVSMFTLKEMKLQRAVGNKPVLQIAPINFSVIYGDGQIWDYEGKKLDSPYLELMNFGNGTAYEITAKWNYDIENAVNILKQCNSDSEYFVSRNNVVFIGNSAHNVKVQNTISIMGLRCDVNKNVYRMNVPTYFEKVFREYLFENQSVFFSLSGDDEFEKSFFTMELELSYYDISREQHVQQFEIMFEMIFGSKQHESGFWKEFRVRLDCREIK